MLSYAWQWQGDENPQALEKVSRSVPEPKVGEVLVANRAIALNPVDWKAMTWQPAYWPLNRIPGVDGVGEVIAVGAGVSTPKVTIVAYHQGIDQDGSYAFHTIVKEKALIPVPATLDVNIAATMLCPGLTAYQALQKIPTEPNRNILITGAGSSVGLFLTQLALQKGFRVWATASVKHHQRLRQLGVKELFDYHDETWQTQLQQKVQTFSLYAVIDTVGVEQAAQLASLVAYNGHLVCIMGRIEQVKTPAFATAISYHEVALASIYKFGCAEDWVMLRESGISLLNGLAKGTLLAPEINTIGFDEIPVALKKLKESESTNKLIAILDR